MSKGGSSSRWSDLSSIYDLAIHSITSSKRVAENSYLHNSLVDTLDENLRKAVDLARVQAGLQFEEFNVVRFSHRRKEIALLNYEDFHRSSFPALRSSCLIDIDEARISVSRFDAQDNPPILHRKELLLPENHELRAPCEELTRILEDFGAFDQPLHLIGRRKFWSESLRRLGLDVVDGKVRRTLDGLGNIARHRTAIARSSLSSPMQALVRWGFLNDADVFDYGCGRGDDVRALRQANIRAIGWDPHYAPEVPKTSADIVNLGFVLNVIEDPHERQQALVEAYHLARRVLAVSVMLNGKGVGNQAGDGVVTRRRTFQKYYAQSEIADYIRGVLNREPIAVGPGIFFLFRSDFDEQAFLDKRQRSEAISRDALDGMFPRRPSLAASPTRARRSNPNVYDKNRDLLDVFWETHLALGRLPEQEEFDLTQLKAKVGSVRKAIAALPYADKEEQLSLACKRRTNDLLVYLGLNLFERRRSLSALPRGIQRDIRAFFGSHAGAIARARDTLFSAGSLQSVRQAIDEASSLKTGVVASDGDFSFFKGMLSSQPALIRLIVGCAERLESLPEGADFVKIHANTGQVSFIEFESFRENPLPPVIRRIRVDLRSQRVRTLISDETGKRRVLFGKSDFIPTNFRRFDTQVRFDQKLAAAKIYANSGLGMNEEELGERLRTAGIKLVGFRILPLE